MRAALERPACSAGEDARQCACPGRASVSQYTCRPAIIWHGPLRQSSCQIPGASGSRVHDLTFDIGLDWQQALGQVLYQVNDVIQLEQIVHALASGDKAD